MPAQRHSSNLTDRGSCLAGWGRTRSCPEPEIRLVLEKIGMRQRVVFKPAWMGSKVLRRALSAQCIRISQHVHQVEAMGQMDHSWRRIAGFHQELIRDLASRAVESSRRRKKGRWNTRAQKLGFSLKMKKRPDWSPMRHQSNHEICSTRFSWDISNRRRSPRRSSSGTTLPRIYGFRQRAWWLGPTKRELGFQYLNPSPDPTTTSPTQQKRSNRRPNDSRDVKTSTLFRALSRYKLLQP